MGTDSAIQKNRLDLDSKKGVMIGLEKQGVNDIPLLEAKETRVTRRMSILSQCICPEVDDMTAVNELPLDVSKELVDAIRKRLEKLEKRVESLRVSLFGNPVSI